MNHLTLYEISQHCLQALDVFTDPEVDIPGAMLSQGTCLAGYRRRTTD